MPGDPSSFAQEREIREMPWAALVLCLIGGFLLLMVVILAVVFLVEPPKNKPPAPWAPFVAPVIGLVLLGVGIYWFLNAHVALRLRPRDFQLPQLGATIPWADVAEVDVVHRPAPLLVMYLTPAGRKSIGERRLSNSPQAGLIDPRPDVCLKCNFISYGPDIESPVDFVADLRNRIAAATGDIEARPPLPDIDGALLLRDDSATGPNARVYIHDDCGGGTVISDGSLYWACNPLRYTGGQSVCSQCGPALDVALRWQETGENLSRFRRRMWRKTSLVVKLLQFIIVPALIAAAAAYLVPKYAPLAPNLSPMAKGVTVFITGFIAGVLLIVLTPLAGVIPALAGYRYHKYR